VIGIGILPVGSLLVQAILRKPLEKDITLSH